LPFTAQVENTVHFGDVPRIKRAAAEVGTG
jgi:hypothetical protein